MDLLIDIGGTNARVCAVEKDRLSAPCRYKTAGYKSASDLLAAYLHETGASGVSRVFLAVAGPVSDGCAELTNADFSVDAAALKKAFRLSDSAVLNDLEALAYNLADPSGLNAIALTPAAPAPGKTSIVVAPGTGLGLAARVIKDGRVTIVGTQGGHVRAAPSTPVEFDLCAMMSRNDDYLCAEDLLSGPGMTKIYAGLSALKGGGTKTAPPDARTPDARSIVSRALAGSDPLATETIDIYLSMLGSYCGDMALVFLSYGGVYLAGNIINGLAPLIGESRLAPSFLNKGLMAPLMGEIGFGRLPMQEPVLEGLKVFAQQR